MGRQFKESSSNKGELKSHHINETEYFFAWKNFPPSIIWWNSIYFHPFKIPVNIWLYWIQFSSSLSSKHIFFSPTSKHPRVLQDLFFSFPSPTLSFFGGVKIMYTGKYIQRDSDVKRKHGPQKRHHIWIEGKFSNKNVMKKSWKWWEELKHMVYATA